MSESWTPEWIAVTPETMPKTNQFVLANVASGVRVVQWRGNGWTTIPGGWSCKPSHWMPLPSPPVLP